MSKSKARKPEANLSPKKGRHNDAVSTDRASHSAAATSLIGSLQIDLDAELSGKIKELVRLAQEQGHLTYNDISEALPENAIVLGDGRLTDQNFRRITSRTCWGNGWSDSARRGIVRKWRLEGGFSCENAGFCVSHRFQQWHATNCAVRC